MVLENEPAIQAHTIEYIYDSRFVGKTKTSTLNLFCAEFAPQPNSTLTKKKVTPILCLSTAIVEMTAVVSWFYPSRQAWTPQGPGFENFFFVRSSAFKVSWVELVYA